MSENQARRWIVGWVLLGSGMGLAIRLGEWGPPYTDWWLAWFVTVLPLLLNLRKKSVAEPSGRRKMLSVEGDLLRRMGLVLALALVVFVVPGSTLTQQFWVALAVWYQAALALDVWLHLARLRNDTTAVVDSPRR